MRKSRGTNKCMMKIREKKWKEKEKKNQMNFWFKELKRKNNRKKRNNREKNKGKDKDFQI